MTGEDGGDRLRAVAGESDECGCDNCRCGPARPLGEGARRAITVHGAVLERLADMPETPTKGVL